MQKPKNTFRAGKYHPDQISQRKNRINILKNIDLLGQFDFQNLIITLDSLSSKDIEFMLENSSFEISKKILPLVHHEYTHFLDTTSTLWGLNHLLLMQNAYSIDYRQHGEERNFYHGKIFFDYLKRIKLPDYYNQIGKGDNHNTEWKKINSIGILFSQNGRTSTTPIVFTNFISANGDFIARSPFSDLSLLECRATYQETAALLKIISTEDADFQIIEKQRLKNQLQSNLYNKYLTEYSVCTHLVAEKTTDDDILFSLTTANPIARFCLNAPTSVFNKIIQNKSAYKFLQGNTETKRRFELGLRNKNRGILYYLIIETMPTLTNKNPDSVIDTLKNTLSKLGVSKDWQHESKTEANNLRKKILAGKIPLIREIANAGYINLDETINIDKEINFQSLHLPPCYLNDLQQFNPFFTEKIG